jgi:heme exporter protein A
VISALELEALAIDRGGRMLFAGLAARLVAGEALAVTGANGSGKTSLLRAVAGFIRPAAGRIVFEGPPDADEARRCHCHLLGHQDALKPGRRARDELLFQASWCGASPSAALAAAERMGVARQLDLDVRRLSAGQKRRLSLARLLAAPRALWLLDEVLAPLDAPGRALMGEVMAEHLGRGGMILAAAHDPLPITARSLELGR